MAFLTPETSHRLSAATSSHPIYISCPGPICVAFATHPYNSRQKKSQSLSCRHNSPLYVTHTPRPGIHIITTSSHIYLSRGVAGTKSEPALPVLDLQPLHVASYFESSDARRLSLSPQRLPSEPISQDLVHSDYIFHSDSQKFSPMSEPGEASTCQPSR